jgi:hypothetical protein
VIQKRDGRYGVPKSNCLQRLLADADGRNEHGVPGLSRIIIDELDDGSVGVECGRILSIRVFCGINRIRGKAQALRNRELPSDEKFNVGLFEVGLVTRLLGGPNLGVLEERTHKSE